MEGGALRGGAADAVWAQLTVVHDWLGSARDDVDDGFDFAVVGEPAYVEPGDWRSQWRNI